ncbi:hypothetical protein QAD02_018949 [Eretmocerus hayati]|uniref:Uncharacterized protein n=1 Tax=Eretmocerus hayati TaxID=131215 RepID=A0ACC2PL78_9HYME|nr:hypothetical protein QAD02_018949 [Eretmocerus hayati]
MSRPTIRRRNTDLQLESVARISKVPIVESGIHIANNVYEKIKRSNFLIYWSLGTAEHSLALATATAMPTMVVFNMPIKALDYVLCKGIDIVERRIPAVNLPPHLMYWNTREYVNNKFVKPVLIRADSVKMIGSQAANAAVDKLNGAIDVADQYVDHYLPPDPADKIDESVTDSPAKEETNNKAIRTIEHGARFSRKLQRRLTKRTFAEARALKEQGTECIHVLLYVVELVATDPKLAWQKAKELWGSLSLPEPENQARPTNLEQLLVLCTRETARRIVHLVNGTTNLAARAPRRLARTLLRISHRLIAISEKAFKVVNEKIYSLLSHAAMLAKILTSNSRRAVTTLSTTNQTNANPLTTIPWKSSSLISEDITSTICDKLKLCFPFSNNGVCGKSIGSPMRNGNNTGNRVSLIANIEFVSVSHGHSDSDMFPPKSIVRELILGEKHDNLMNETVNNGRSRTRPNEMNSGLLEMMARDLTANAQKVIPSIAHNAKKLQIKSPFACNGRSMLPLRTKSGDRIFCSVKTTSISGSRQN